MVGDSGCVAAGMVSAGWRATNGLHLCPSQVPAEGGVLRWLLDRKLGQGGTPVGLWGPGRKSGEGLHPETFEHRCSEVELGRVHWGQETATGQRAQPQGFPTLMCIEPRSRTPPSLGPDSGFREEVSGEFT